MDIIVDFSDRIGVRFIDLAEDLENIVGFKVDLVSRKGIKEKYLRHIDSDLIYIYILNIQIGKRKVKGLEIPH